MFEGIYKFVYPFLASFDPSFLYVKGDDFLIHSTGTHGMYLLATIPFFITGLFYSWKKGNFWRFIIISFFAGPLLFGLVGSIHRASRMLAEVPLYSLICAVGFLYFWESRKRIVLFIFAFALVANYFDFIHYYLGNYAKDTANLFSCFECLDAQFKKLKDESVDKNLIPYIDVAVAEKEDTTADFARTIYFLEKPPTWDGKPSDLPKNAILMTDNDHLKDLKLIGRQSNLFYYTY